MNQETKLQNQIMAALSARGHIVHRTNAGNYYTADGRTVKIGSKGTSDLQGHRATDGRAFYLEIKTPAGHVLPEQHAFLQAMSGTGAIAGVARSVKQALEIVEET